MTQPNGNTPAIRQQATPATRVAVDPTAPIRDLDQTYRLAQALAGSSLLPQALRGKTNDVLVTMLYGQELGLAPMQAIQAIYVVNGRPTMAGQLWLAKARAAGHRVEVLEHTQDKCTVKVTRGDTGETHAETFTMADAKIAKLDQKDTYRQHPRRMLLWRAVSNACTFICPEIALGFGDELDREPAAPEPARPTLADVAAHRDDPVDAEIVHTTGEPVDDASVRDQVLTIAAEHTGDQLPVEDPPAEPDWLDEPAPTARGRR